MSGWEPKSSPVRGYAGTRVRILYCMFNYTHLFVFEFEYISLNSAIKVFKRRNIRSSVFLRLEEKQSQKENLILDIQSIIYVKRNTLHSRLLKLLKR